MDNTQESLKSKVSSFFLQCKRVWHLLRKPTTQEFKTIATVSAMGILVLGAIGFVVADLIKLIGKVF
ncbi:MAG TPA: protein translocase SEC61 complex subunit gamma [Candidatus Nanoarchaeia archaeon]|nr:protein translocase SEC61 complex subunit gamma [Candidatus Nanoarchaeia archaeon]